MEIGKLVKWLVTIPGLIVLGIVGYFFYKHHAAAAAAPHPGAIVAPAANGGPTPIAPSPLAPQAPLSQPAQILQQANTTVTQTVQQATALINAGNGILTGITNLFGGSDDGS